MNAATDKERRQVPIRIDHMTSEIQAFDGDVPLSEKQLARIVDRVLERVEEKQRADRHLRQATSLRTASRKPSPVTR